MRVTTSDGSFGFLIERTRQKNFNVFQLVIAGVSVGDRNPCILWTAMRQLRSLNEIPAGVPTRRRQAEDILARIRGDDGWNDASLAPLAESLDAWDVRAYIDEGLAVFILDDDRSRGDQKRPLVGHVGMAEYRLLVEALTQYWAEGQTT